MRCVLKRRHEFFSVFLWGCILTFFLPSSSLAQSSEQKVLSKEYQRWIPVRRPAEEDLAKLLEGLKKGGTSNPPSIPNFVKEGLKKITPEQIDGTLSKLSPSQKEELKKLAEQFQSSSKDGKWQQEELGKLSPDILEKLKSSQELQKLAKDLTRNPSGEKSSQDANDETVPPEPELDLDRVDQQLRIPFDPGTAQKGNPASNKSPDARRDVPSNLSPSSQQSPASSQPTSSNVTKGSKTTPTPRIAENAPNSVRPNPGKDRGNPNGSFRPRNPGIDPHRPNSSSEGLPSADPGQSSPFPPLTQQNGQSKSSSNDSRNSASNPALTPGARRSNGTDKPNDSQARPLDSNTGLVESISSKGQESSPNSGVARTTPRAPTSESAVDMFRRKVRELGVSQTIEKITQEAIGIERARSSSTSPSPQGSTDKSRQPRIATDEQRPKSQRINRWQPRDDSSLDQGSDRNPSSIANASRASSSESRIEPQPSFPQTESAAAPSTPFQMPKLSDLPSLSIWHVVLVMALVGMIVSLFLLQRSPELMAKLTGRVNTATAATDFGPMEIKNRSHVIQAFHALIQHRIQSLEDWWTSKRVVSYAEQHDLRYQPSLSKAASVYDVARYAPADVELTEVELEAMRQAVRECASTKVD
jgi:hypothetical protein